MAKKGQKLTWSDFQQQFGTIPTGPELPTAPREKDENGYSIGGRRQFNHDRDENSLATMSDQWRRETPVDSTPAATSGGAGGGSFGGGGGERRGFGDEAANADSDWLGRNRGGGGSGGPSYGGPRGNSAFGSGDRSSFGGGSGSGGDRSSFGGGSGSASGSGGDRFGSRSGGDRDSFGMGGGSGDRTSFGTRAGSGGGGGGGGVGGGSFGDRGADDGRSSRYSADRSDAATEAEETQDWRSKAAAGNGSRFGRFGGGGGGGGSRSDAPREFRTGDRFRPPSSGGGGGRDSGRPTRSYGHRYDDGERSSRPMGSSRFTQDPARPRSSNSRFGNLRPAAADGGGSGVQRGWEQPAAAAPSSAPAVEAPATSQNGHEPTTDTKPTKSEASDATETPASAASTSSSTSSPAGPSPSKSSDAWKPKKPAAATGGPPVKYDIFGRPITEETLKEKAAEKEKLKNRRKLEDSKKAGPKKDVKGDMKGGSKKPKKSKDPKKKMEKEKQAKILGQAMEDEEQVISAKNLYTGIPHIDIQKDLEPFINCIVRSIHEGKLSLADSAGVLKERLPEERPRLFAEILCAGKEKFGEKRLEKFVKESDFDLLGALGLEKEDADEWFEARGLMRINPQSDLESLIVGALQGPVEGVIQVFKEHPYPTYPPSVATAIASHVFNIFFTIEEGKEGDESREQILKEFIPLFELCAPHEETENQIVVLIAAHTVRMKLKWEKKSFKTLLRLLYELNIITQPNMDAWRHTTLKGKEQSSKQKALLAVMSYLNDIAPKQVEKEEDDEEDSEEEFSGSEDELDPLFTPNPNYD